MQLFRKRMLIAAVCLLAFAAIAAVSAFGQPSGFCKLPKTASDGTDTFYTFGNATNYDLNYLQPLSTGSLGYIAGSFPGLFAENHATDPVLTTQGVKIYIDNACHQARISQIGFIGGEPRIVFWFPTDYAPVLGTATVYVVRLVGGVDKVVASESYTFARYAPAFYRQEGFWSTPNGVVGSYSIFPSGPLDANITINQAIPVPAPGSTLFIKLRGAGFYREATTPTPVCAINNVSAPCSIANDPVLPGNQVATIEVPASQWNAGISQATFSVNGATVTHPPLLAFGHF